MICLLGGTFDPVHIGHLHAAETVRAALELAEVRLLLSADPYHKEPTGASAEHRWQMLRLACAERPSLVPDDRELGLDRPSYTVLTLEEIRAERPGEAVAWIIGSDAFALLPTWHRWQDLLSLANLVVVKRPGHPLELEPVMRALLGDHEVTDLAGVGQGGILILEDEMAEVASADIRAGLAAGRDMGHLLPAPVAHYIRENRLYGVAP